MEGPFAGLFRLRSSVAILASLFSVACGDSLVGGGSGTPMIVSVSPATESNNVSVLTDLEIRFSTELDPASVAAAVRLETEYGEVLTRKVLKNSKLVILEPTDPLDFGASYRVVVDPTLLSRSGKPVLEGESWGFSTEGDPFPSLEIDSLLATLEALAHDSMKGRGSGTEDELRAAQYLSRRFEAYGLEAPSSGTLQFFQALSRKTQEVLSSQNVLALIPGSGSLSDEWVVVGAHYDHIGLREQADGTRGINNGADDNGSGTVLVLEMARVFRKHVSNGGIPTNNRRGVLFVAFGAEEEGLLGSCHYALEAPAVPISSTRAMMNFDMVGRLTQGVVQVGGVESANHWADMLQNTSRPELIPYAPPLCQSCSDFSCFQDRGVPYLWFFTGLHDQYHTPLDDVERINLPGLTKIGELSLRLLGRLVVLPGDLS